MSRLVPPQTRNGLTHHFSVGGHEGYITVGLYDDGVPCDIFVVMSKEGSTLGGVMRCWATAFSICLQYGVPLERLVEKFKASSFEPRGATENPAIPEAQSVVDYVVRWLELKYSRREVTV